VCLSLLSFFKGRFVNGDLPIAEDEESTHLIYLDCTHNIRNDINGIYP